MYAAFSAPGQVLSGPDDAGQIIAVVEAAGIRRRAAVAQQQRPDVAFGLGLNDRVVERDLAMRTEPDVAVGVHQSGQNPADSGSPEDGVGPGHRFGADVAVDDPQFDLGLVG